MKLFEADRDPIIGFMADRSGSLVALIFRANIEADMPDEPFLLYEPVKLKSRVMTLAVKDAYVRTAVRSFMSDGPYSVALYKSAPLGKLIVSIPNARPKDPALGELEFEQMTLEHIPALARR